MEIGVMVGQERVRALARGLATGLVIEHAARDANMSLSTALAIYGSDAFKNLLAEQHAYLTREVLGTESGVIN